MLRRYAFTIFSPAAFVLTSCAANTGGSGSSLTTLQKEAVDVTAAAVSDMATALAGTEPSSEVSESGAAQTFPDCPELDIQIGGGALTVTLDYGESCNPILFPDATFSGMVSGSLSFSQGAAMIEYQFDQFTVDGRTTDGSILGSLVRSGDVLTLDALVDLASSEGNSVNASMSADIDRSTGLITIDQADATVVKAETGTVEITYEGIVIDHPNNGNFIPESGTAIFVLPNDGEGPETITVVVEFTADSPSTRTVLVTIGENEPVEHTL